MGPGGDIPGPIGGHLIGPLHHHFCHHCHLDLNLVVAVVPVIAVPHEPLMSDDRDNEIMGDNSDNEEGMAAVHHSPTSPPIAVNNCLHSSKGE